MLPECYNSVIEFNSLTTRRENTFTELFESENSYDRIAAQKPVNLIHTNNSVFFGQTHFTHLSRK